MPYLPVTGQYVAPKRVTPRTPAVPITPVGTRPNDRAGTLGISSNARLLTAPIKAAPTSTHPPQTTVGGTTATPQVASTSTAVTKPSYDYSGDPILQQIISQGDKDETAARSAATAEQKRFLIGFGSRAVAQELMGVPAEDPWLQGISADPNTSFSTLANIANQYNQNYAGINENLNAANMFYSSQRLNQQLPELARNRLQTEYGAEQDLRDAIRNSQGNLAAALKKIRDDRLAAEAAAYQRAIDMGPSSGAGDGGAGGGGGDGGAGGGGGQSGPPLAPPGYGPIGSTIAPSASEDTYDVGGIQIRPPTAPPPVSSIPPNVFGSPIGNAPPTSQPPPSPIDAYADLTRGMSPAELARFKKLMGIPG